MGRSVGTGWTCTDGLLAAASGEEPVEVAMAALAARVGAPAAGVTLWSHGAFVAQSWTGLPHDFERDYTTHFSACDPWARAGLSRRQGSFFTSDELVARTTLEASTFHAELCRPHRISDLCGGVIASDDDVTVTVGVLRPADARGDGERERAAFAPIASALSCLGRALIARRRLAAARDAEDVVPFGVLTVDLSTGVVLTMNAAGSRLVARGLVASTGQRLVVDGEPLWDLVRTSTLFTRRTTRASSVRVLIHRVAEAREARICIIHIHHAGSVAKERAERAARVFGLSRREASIAEHILLGACPKEIAACHGVAVSTLRTQVRTLYAKVGVERQSALVAILSEL